MTLRDLWLTIRHYLKWVIAVPVVCALLAGGFMYASDRMSAQNYTATSTLTVTDPTAILSATSLSNLMDALAQNEVAAAADNVTTATAKTDPLTQSVVFSVTGASEVDAVDAANGIASRTVESIKQALSSQSEEYQEIADTVTRADADAMQPSGITTADRVAALRSCVFTVTEAKTAEASGSSGVIKYAAVGFVGGLFLVVCFLVFFDSIKRPIKGRADIAQVTDLSVLADDSDALFGERLWTNIQFCAKGDVRLLCLIPVSGAPDTTISDALSRAIAASCSDSARSEYATNKDESTCCPSIANCGALGEDVAGARTARDSSAVVVVVRLWDDTAQTLRDTLSELALANAPIVGVVIAN